MVNMLVKCETKSNRVKGVAFHPTLPWVLSALHNGTIQLWDYQLGVLLDKFDEHEGPVRGMCFHPNQPIFVSGGDDYKVKVWNYKEKRCLFTLQGHLDYVRTTTFHHEYPWILSASDDQTIRIWNWQSRQCIAVMTGHNHYVMSASFHPKDNLVISASLDQTVRVWDVSGLKEKTVSTNRPPTGSGLTAAALANADIFGVNDAVVKFVLEGHDRGVNWAEFHPTLPLIVSASDDRTIKIWRMNESKAWEIDSLRGHFNNVSCVTFHPRQDLIISNGEDKTIRVWDATKRTLLHTFKRENDRFWVLACQRNSNLIAAGHDGGMVVFKLDRERPLYGSPPSAGHVYVVKNRQLTAVSPDGSSIVIGACKKQLSAMSSGYKSLVVNPFNSTEMNVLVTYEYDGGCYELYTGTNQSVLRGASSDQQQPSVASGPGSSVVFIARNRFTVLSKDGLSISVFSLHNELSKKVDLPIVAESIFAGGLSNRIILKSEDKVVLLDVGSREIIGELALTGVRQVVWSSGNEYVSFLQKHGVVIANGNDLKFIHSVSETIRVKSGVWDDASLAFIYTTSSHVKYALPYAGEVGMIQSMPKIGYLVRVISKGTGTGQMIYVDRDCGVVRTRLFTQEFLFKLALIGGRSGEVMEYLQSGRLLGSVTIGYLKKRGFPEVALHFVNDMETRFNLSLEFGHLSEAFASASCLKNPQIWNRLGKESIKLGNIEMAEKCFVASHNLEELRFLYLLTGNQAKLAKLSLKAARDRDHMTRFNLGLIRGDVGERVAVLKELGLELLAKRTIETYSGSSVSAGGAAALIPRPPVGQTSNWPMTRTMEDMFAAQWAGIEAAAAAAAIPPPKAGSDEIDELATPTAETVNAPKVDAKAWGDDELDMELENVVVPVVTAVSGDTKSVVAYGESLEKQWLSRRRLPGDLVACGEFAEALSVLSRRISLVNSKPLEGVFMDAMLASHAYVPGLPFTPSISVPIVSSSLGNMPFILFNVKYLQERFGGVLTQTGVGNSAEALEAARYCLHALTLSVACSEEEEEQLKSVLKKSRQYAFAMLMETTRRHLSQDANQKQRELELAAYLCLSKIDPTHLLLVVGSAMNISFRARNFILASHFARRIITGNWSGADQEIVGSTTMRARKVLAASEEKGTDEFKINFDPAWLSLSNDQVKFCAIKLCSVRIAQPSIIQIGQRKCAPFAN
jgi:coatomer protein complex subunit alpha (xenin)